MSFVETIVGFVPTPFQINFECTLRDYQNNPFLSHQYTKYYNKRILISKMFGCVYYNIRLNPFQTGLFWSYTDCVGQSDPFIISHKMMV